MSDQLSRKTFVSIVGGVAAAETVPAPADAQAKHPAPRRAPSHPLATLEEAYTYFTAPEAAFVEAAVARLIPGDALGPGAREAGVAYYIDQQLSAEFGYAAKMYMHGPWAEGLPTQGYQLRLTPRQVYRLGIAETNQYTRRQYGKSFDALSATAHQDAILTALDQAKVTFESVPAKTFFEMLLANTIEGFFADPMYGGNRNKVGWRLVGFPGAAAAYIGLIETHNKAYSVAPQSVGDLQQQEQVGAAGGMDKMMVHEMVARKSLGLR
jgi:gluconate 2-dehydrogenase gamma chain